MSWLALAAKWVWSALRAIPPRVWAILAAVALAWWLIVGYGDRRAAEAEAAVQARWDAENAAEAIAAAQAAEAARKTEERHRAEYRAIAERFLADQRKADEAHRRTVADLRAGRLRLQERFTCPAVPGAAGDSGSPLAEGARGLGTEDAAEILRLARESDRIAAQLNALIDAVEAGR